jgi:hypothetical protein
METRGRLLPVLGGIALLLGGCGTLMGKDAHPAADDGGCGEALPPGQRVSAVMVNRSWLGRYPTLQSAVAECFAASDTGAVLLSLRVSRTGTVCDPTLQRDSTGKPASIRCFLGRFVRWEMAVGAYRLLIDLNDRV